MDDFCNKLIRWKITRSQIPRHRIRCAQKLLHLNQDFGDEIVYLEFDSQLITDESLRHYAFPTGDNGITELPIILTLPENRLDFNYEEFITQLSIKTDFALNEDSEE